MCLLCDNKVQVLVFWQRHQIPLTLSVFIKCKRRIILHQNHTPQKQRQFERKSHQSAAH